MTDGARRLAMAVAVACVCLVTVACGGKGSEASRAVQCTAGQTQIRAVDGAVMVCVPAGEFLMGSTQPEVDAALAACNAAGQPELLCRQYVEAEAPQHKVTLDAFWIDRTEVTNGQYQAFAGATGHTPPTACKMGQPTYGDPTKALFPAVCVSPEDARAYCAWAGARLPSEAEWEKAARATDGRLYPWGSQAPDCNRANFWADSGLCNGSTVAVGLYPAGASLYGALDMAGNASEWVNDWFSTDFYRRSPGANPKGPGSGDTYVQRGGSWIGKGFALRTAFRTSGYAGDRFDDVGFRCAAP